MNRNLLRGILVAVLLGLLGWAGWSWYRRAGASQLMTAGVKALTQGQQALLAKDAAQAQVRLDEANLYASKAIDQVNKESEQQANPSAEELKRLQEASGQAFYLKALALRDLAFAKSLAEGKEIGHTLDATTGKPFRSFMAIPDQKTRGEALQALRVAAIRLPQSEDVVLEALRNEIQIVPLNWELLRQFCEMYLSLHPNDSRALFALAKFDYEQPQISKNQPVAQPSALEKRTRSRMLAALDRLGQLKQNAEPPFLWRTLYLEGQIHAWLLNDAMRRGEDRAKQLKQLDKLDQLLFAEPQGALAQAVNGAGLANLSPWDTDGALGIFRLALDNAIEQHRQVGQQLPKIARVVHDTQAFCQKVRQDYVKEFKEEQLLETMLTVLAGAQRFLAMDRPKEWQAGLDWVKEQLTKSKDAGPAVVSQLVELLQTQAYWEGRTGHAAQQAALHKDAQAWVAKGIRLAEEQKAPASAAAELHVAAAEALFNEVKADRKTLEPHLQVLRASSAPRHQAIAFLLDGALYERDGRLDKARQSLEKILGLPPSGQELRAYMTLAQVYLAMGQSEKALPALARIETVYDKLEELTPQERAWAQTFLRSPDDLRLLILTAHLDTARAKVAEFVRDHPKTKALPDLVVGYEQKAAALLKKLPPQGKHFRQAQQGRVMYLASTGRPAQADKELAKLQAEMPDSLELLQLEVTLRVQAARAEARSQGLAKIDAAALKAIDQRIQRFLSDFPTNRAARLFWASWLSRTERAGQAVAYLKNAANFPGPKDEAFERVLGLALVAQGERAEGLKVLQHLPQDAQVDAVLIQLASSNDEKTKAVKSAMSRFESNGLFRVWNAQLLLDQGKTKEAALAFAQALDFTRVQAFARAGLQNSLMILSRQDPAATKHLANQLVQDFPDEPAVWIGSALACLALDEVGAPGDSWDSAKSMAAALTRWEQVFLKEGGSKIAGPLTRAEAWLAANRPESARVELMRGLNLEPDNVSCLRLAVQLNLVQPTKPALAQARKYLERLQKVQPDAPATLMLQAQLEDSEGNTRAAIETLEELQEQTPHVDAYGPLVNLLVRENETTRAGLWIERWRKQFPDDLAGKLAEVQELARQKKITEAQKQAAGIVAQQISKIEKSSAAVKDDKDNAKRLGEARWQLELDIAKAMFRGGARDEAENEARRLLKERPDQAAAQLFLGQIYVTEKAWDKAAQLYGEMLEKNQQDFVVGNNLAWILATQLNNPSKALDICRAVGKNPATGNPVPADRLNPEFLDTLGVVYQKLGRKDLWPEMRDLFETARRRYDQDPRMYLYLGHAYAGLADTLKARQMFDSAISLAGEVSNQTVPAVQREQVLRAAEAAKKQLGSR